MLKTAGKSMIFCPTFSTRSLYSSFTEKTKRLLVRGHRVPYVEEEVKEEKTVLSGSSLHTNYLLWVFVGLSVTALFVFVLYLKETKLKRRTNKGGKK